MKSIAQQIRDCRKKAGITQARLSYIIGISIVTISKWENGHVQPTWENLEKVARACGRVLDLKLKG